MLKLSVGDIGFMSFGVVAVLVMLLLNFGVQSQPDRTEERRSRAKFLAQIERTWSPALALASIVGAAGLAYIVVAVYSKLK